MKPLYLIMPDGTVKQINPFTESEVWSVPGRNNKPITNEVPETAKPLEVRHPEDYCSFCQTRYYEVPPEKSRLVKLPDGSYKKIDYLPPDKYFDSVAEFRRVGNLFEIVTLDYWRKNYEYKPTKEKEEWKKSYLENPAGMKHIIDLIHYKLRMMGKSPDEINSIPTEEKLKIADSFFAGCHELIIARRHYIDNAEWTSDLCSSGELTQDEHYWYFKFTIDAMVDIMSSNRYVRYIAVFQNWLRPAGASFDHLHKQLVGLDAWGATIERQIAMVRENPNVYNEYAVNFAGYHNLVFAENENAIAFAGFGHRFPTVSIYSKSKAGRPFELSEKELRDMSDLVYAIHAAMGNQIPCNEEWYYTPFDSVYKMPWHVLIKWRINVPAGFEGGTNIYINPITPIELRDKLVPRLFELRDAGKISNILIAEECKVEPNSLRYYQN